MKAWKVEGYGIGRISGEIKVTSCKISHFTKTRVYLSKNGFENIETLDFMFPHRWFEKKIDALKFVEEKLNQQKQLLQKRLEKVFQLLSKINIIIQEEENNGD